MTITKTGAFIITGDSLAVVIAGVNYTISKTSAMYRKVADAVITGDWDAAQEYLEKATSLKGDIWWNAEKSMVYYGQEPLNHALADRLPRMIAEGFGVDPMIAFLKNLFTNPAEHAVNELYEFMERNALPITEDGCFLAYKKVTEDYLDCHTRSVSNRVGDKPFMERSKCDPNRHNHCSTGYHFCGLSYLSCFGGQRVMIVKVNPADVTSIPSDYGFAKGRCNTYEVVNEYLGTDVPRYDDAFTSSVAPADMDEDEVFDDICDDCGEYRDDCTCDDDPDYCTDCGCEPCDCEIDDPHCPDVPNLFTKPEEAVTSNSTNPVTRARLRAGLTVEKVAEALGMPVKTYLARVEVEGRFFKPSTVGYLLQAIERLAKEA